MKSPESPQVPENDSFEQTSTVSSATPEKKNFDAKNVEKTNKSPKKWVTKEIQLTPSKKSRQKIPKSGSKLVAKIGESDSGAVLKENASIVKERKEISSDEKKFDETDAGKGNSPRAKKDVLGESPAGRKQSMGMKKFEKGKGDVSRHRKRKASGSLEMQIAFALPLPDENDDEAKNCGDTGNDDGNEAGEKTVRDCGVAFISNNPLFEESGFTTFENPLGGTDKKDFSMTHNSTAHNLTESSFSDTFGSEVSDWMPIYASKRPRK